MKFYVAAKFEKKEEVLAIYKKIKDMGHSISYDWTQHKNIKPYSENQETAREYSEKELLGIVDSDIFIYLSDEKGTTLHMEFGSALINSVWAGKPKIYVVGKFNDESPWFFHKKVERRETIDDVLKDFKTVS